jgi:integrase
MAVYKQRNSSVYWYEFQFDGVRYRESSRSTVKAVARDALRARRRQLEEAYNGIKKRQMPKTFSSALDEFLAVKERKVASGTFEIMKRCASHLRPVFGKKLLFEITAADIMEYKEKRLSPSVSPRYVNMDLELMRSVLRRNGFWERIRPDVSMYRLDDEFGYELPISDEPTLLDECARSISRGLYTAVTVALCTGMRNSEIKNLRWNQVFLDGDAYLIVGVSKTTTGRRRRVPLNATAVPALTEWARQFPDRVPDNYVFPAEKYSKEPDGRLAAVYRHDPKRPMGSWRVAWKACCRRAGIQMRFHDLRHTAVTRMLRAGIPLTTVAAIVGWSPSTMYLMAKRYAHILQPEMRKAVAVLGPKAPEPLAIPAGTPPSIIPVPGRLRPSYDRQELYERIWEVPMRTLAKEYGVSDVALARTCRKLNVPVPGRGYWSKKAAQASAQLRPPLPALNEQGINKTAGPHDS